MGSSFSQKRSAFLLSRTDALHNERVVCYLDDLTSLQIFSVTQFCIKIAEVVKKIKKKLKIFYLLATIREIYQFYLNKVNLLRCDLRLLLVIPM